MGSSVSARMSLKVNKGLKVSGLTLKVVVRAGADFLKKNKGFNDPKKQNVRAHWSSLTS